MVGAGPVAAGKIGSLIDAGAHVVVVAPEIHPAIEACNVQLERRPFEDADLDGAWYVIAAAPPDVNRYVMAGAERRRVFVNAVDDPAHATSFAGAVVRRAGVTIAISTGGVAPALAGLVREGLEACLPDDLETWMSTAASAREEWRRQEIPMSDRRPRLLQALNRLYEERGPE